VSIFITGGFWKSYGLRSAWFFSKRLVIPRLVSVAMTVIVFGAMHYAYVLVAKSRVAPNEAISALLFLHYESLVVTVLFSLYWQHGEPLLDRYWHRRVAGLCEAANPTEFPMAMDVSILDSCLDGCTYGSGNWAVAQLFERFWNLRVPEASRFSEAGEFGLVLGLMFWVHSLFPGRKK